MFLSYVPDCIASLGKDGVAFGAHDAIRLTAKTLHPPHIPPKFNGFNGSIGFQREFQNIF